MPDETTPTPTEENIVQTEFESLNVLNVLPTEAENNGETPSFDEEKSRKERRAAIALAIITAVVIVIAFVVIIATT